MYIIEYIGKDKLITTEYNYLRLRKPMPGDPVKLPKGDSNYHNTYGRISTLNAFDSDLMEICLELGSCFLCENHVSISGGPFIWVHKDELVSTAEVKPVRFWNWGDHSPGGGKGVKYIIERPVFQLKERKDSDRERITRLIDEYYDSLEQMKLDNSASPNSKYSLNSKIKYHSNPIILQEN